MKIKEIIVESENNLPNENSLGRQISKNSSSLRQFWQWFGDSEIVDEQHRPLVLSKMNGTVFSNNDLKTVLFVTSSEYETNKNQFYVNSFNLITIDCQNRRLADIEKDYVNKHTGLLGYIRIKGYDGAIFKNTPDAPNGKNLYVLFDGKFTAKHINLKAKPERHDLFPDTFADKDTTVTKNINLGSSRTRKVNLGNLNSQGRIISSTKQGLENFWNWFIGSEVTDSDGKPLVLYHSTNSDFDKFQIGKKSTNNYGLLGNIDVTRSGIFATPDIDFSQEYLRDNDNANVMPIYMSLKNPFDIRDGLTPDIERELEEAGINVRYIINAQSQWELFDNDENDENFLIDTLKNLGYDGAIIVEDSPSGDSSGGTTYVAFHPNQIKSAIGNRGTYATDNDSIIDETS